MSQNSPIEWTDHTFNPWWGCVKVSPACAHCYAEQVDRRYGSYGQPGAPSKGIPAQAPHWGPGSERRFFGDKHWNEPLKWNAAAQKAGKRARVFCASMADVFEDHPDVEA
jgi:protein gp37